MLPTAQRRTSGLPALRPSMSAGSMRSPRRPTTCRASHCQTLQPRWKKPIMTRSAASESICSSPRSSARRSATCSMVELGTRAAPISWRTPSARSTGLSAPSKPMWWRTSTRVLNAAAEGGSFVSRRSRRRASTSPTRLAERERRASKARRRAALSAEARSAPSSVSGRVRCCCSSGESTTAVTGAAAGASASWAATRGVGTTNSASHAAASTHAPPQRAVPAQRPPGVLTGLARSWCWSGVG
jgi:hypothetical protein